MRLEVRNEGKVLLVVMWLLFQHKIWYQILSRYHLAGFERAIFGTDSSRLRRFYHGEAVPKKKRKEYKDASLF